MRNNIYWYPVSLLSESGLDRSHSVQLLLRFRRGRGRDGPELLDHPLPGGVDELVHVALAVARGLDGFQNSVERKFSLD